MDVVFGEVQFEVVRLMCMYSNIYLFIDLSPLVEEGIDICCEKN
jgi:hypothetical protein